MLKNILNKWLTLSILISGIFSSNAFGETIAPEAAYGRKIHSIRIDGLKRTKSYVALREIRIREGDLLDADRYKEALQRLRNLQIFSTVEGELFTSENSETVDLLIKVEERWTTLPILRSISAGGETLIIGGLYDINTFGRYLEFGGQYENLSGSHSGVVWFRDPRFLNEFVRIGGDIWYQMRNRDFYDGSGTLEGAFTLQRLRLHFFADHEFHRYLTFGAGIDFQDDELTDDELSSDRIALNAANGFVFPISQQSLFFQLYTTVGRLNYNVFLVDGYQSLIEYNQALEGLGSDETLHQVTVTNNAFWLLPWQANLAAQLRFGGTDTEALQYQYYLGAFDSIRGFKDGKFNGGAFWNANIEYRIPSVMNRYIILQHVGFYDIGQTTEAFGDIFKFEEEAHHSIGTGIRVISPKVYRFNLRLDVSMPIGGDNELDFAFGTQQFF